MLIYDKEARSLVEKTQRATVRIHRRRTSRNETNLGEENLKQFPDLYEALSCQDLVALSRKPEGWSQA